MFEIFLLIQFLLIVVKSDLYEFIYSSFGSSANIFKQRKKNHRARERDAHESGKNAHAKRLKNSLISSEIYFKRIKYYAIYKKYIFARLSLIVSIITLEISLIIWCWTLSLECECTLIPLSRKLIKLSFFSLLFKILTYKIWQIVFRMFFLIFFFCSHLNIKNNDSKFQVSSSSISKEKFLIAAILNFKEPLHGCCSCRASH